jgi:hypothetical protein
MSSKIYVMLVALMTAFMLHSLSNTSTAYLNRPWNSFYPTNSNEATEVAGLVNRRAYLLREIAELQHVLDRLRTVRCFCERRCPLLPA